MRTARAIAPRSRVTIGCERGVVGLEVLPLLVLVFVVGTLAFVESWAALDAKIAATAGAREAARTFVEHPAGRGAEAVTAAVRAGNDAIAGYHLAGIAEVRLVGSARLRRCERAIFEANQRVPSLAPSLTPHERSEIVMRARSSEVVDPFRHGLGGRASCAV